MTFLSLHALVFLVANGLLVFAWAMLRTDDTTFWPAWPLALWGGLLVLHAGVTAVLGLRRLRKRRRERKREERETPDPTPDGGTSWNAVMFVDLVGSARLSESLGDEAWGEMIATFRHIVRDVVSDHDGSEVGTQGDGSLLRFPSPADAAGPGEVLVTEPVLDHADPGVPAGNRGLVELAGLDAPRHLLALRFADA